MSPNNIYQQNLWMHCSVIVRFDFGSLKMETNDDKTVIYLQVLELDNVCMP